MSPQFGPTETVSGRAARTLEPVLEVLATLPKSPFSGTEQPPLERALLSADVTIFRSTFSDQSNGAPLIVYLDDLMQAHSRLSRIANVAGHGKGGQMAQQWVSRLHLLRKAAQDNFCSIVDLLINHDSPLTRRDMQEISTAQKSIDELVEYVDGLRSQARDQTGSQVVSRVRRVNRFVQGIAHFFAEEGAKSMLPFLIPAGLLLFVATREKSG